MLSDYLVIDLNVLFEVVNGIRFSIGSIFSIALYCFLGMLGIYLVVLILNYLVR